MGMLAVIMPTTIMGRRLKRTMLVECRCRENLTCMAPTPYLWYCKGVQVVQTSKKLDTEQDNLSCTAKNVTLGTLFGPIFRALSA